MFMYNYLRSVWQVCTTVSELLLMMTMVMMRIKVVRSSMMGRAQLIITLKSSSLVSLSMGIPSISDMNPNKVIESPCSWKWETFSNGFLAVSLKRVAVD